MADKTTYLLPIWIDLELKKPELIIETLNDELTEFFEKQCDQIGQICPVNVQWSICKHVKLGEEGAQDGET